MSCQEEQLAKKRCLGRTFGGMVIAKKVIQTISQDFPDYPDGVG